MDILRRTIDWFRKAIPNPTEQTLQVQLGVHFEEVAEFADTLVGRDAVTQQMLLDLKVSANRLAIQLKNPESRVTLPEENRVEFIDAVADQIVTAAGSAYQAKMLPCSALNEVNESNFSKFDEEGNPIFDENGKIMKGPNYRKAVLEPFV